MGNRYAIDWDAYARMARKAAADWADLLKYDKNVLPLKEGRGCRSLEEYSSITTKAEQAPEA